MNYDFDRAQKKLLECDKVCVAYKHCMMSYLIYTGFGKRFLSNCLPGGFHRECSPLNI